MGKRDKYIAFLRHIVTAGFFFYGLFCVFSQTAYCPAMSPSVNYRYIQMNGTHGVAFGASLMLIAVLFGELGRRWSDGKKKHLAWMIQATGIAIAVGLGWYALLGGTEVR